MDGFPIKGMRHLSINRDLHTHDKDSQYETDGHMNPATYHDHGIAQALMSERV